ncbi:PepSY domain-containing protein [Mangrovibacillus cuniculi]|uniref:PepSY domain-containing protein n=1 Tax=Mangrovibacillus cuniculi TaxID=2593652 RepID=A0A7S8HGZ6_9BACI|nr:PepSY domain-containing protein [Mangrovibacillus cuniculi]
MWRWHFFAGILVAPFVLILAISGGVYLFKPQIESMVYNDLYYVKESGEAELSISKQIDSVKLALPSAMVTSIQLQADDRKTTQINYMDGEAMRTAYVNPYTGEYQGSLANEQKVTEIFRRIHGELFVGGTAANYLVELAACWTLILVITGLYLWWPRKKSSIWGTIIPRWRNKKLRLRDLHAVPAFWLSFFTIILILTGLPWSGVMGEQINRLATATNSGYPAFAYPFMGAPESPIKATDVADDVPWASENLAVPASSPTPTPISMEDASHVASFMELPRPYTLSLPRGETGVYTLSSSHGVPTESFTIHLDQYSGNVLSDVRYDDFGIMAKAITLGIALHEGRLFGLPNQLIGLLVCIGLIFVVLSALVLWRKRKPEKHSGAPTTARTKSVTISAWVIMVLFGLLMPLVGASLIIVFLLDRILLSRWSITRKWLQYD